MSSQLPPEDRHKASASRLDRHLALLGIDDNATTVANSTANERDALAREQKLLDTVGPLPPLILSETKGEGKRPTNRSQSIRRKVGAFMAMAAGVSLCLWVSSREDGGPWQTKGPLANVTVYVQQQGLVTPLVAGMPLASGTKVRVEVTTSEATSEPSLAFMAVTGHQGQILTDVRETLTQPLPVLPGERAAFPGSLELVGPNAGENVVVVVCPETIFAQLDANARDSALSEAFSQHRLPPGLALCHLTTVDLNRP